MSKQTITFCRICNDGWCDEDFMFGFCCGHTLSTRLETDEEENSRESAIASILKQAEGIGW